MYRVVAILLLLLIGQTSGVARAGGHSVAHHAAGTVQRCTHRVPASGAVAIGFGPGADLIFFGLWFMRLETLLGYDNRDRLIPIMATKVPSRGNGGIRDGGTTVLFTLKQGLRWSNGMEITSADVRFGLQALRDPAAAPADNCPWCSLITRIDTPDRYTVIFRLHHAAPTLLDALANAWDAILPTSWGRWWDRDPHKAAVALNADPTWTWIGPGFPSDGPYYLASATATESIFHPMKYYTTMACGASIQTITLRSYPSKAALLAAAASHQVDLIETGSLNAGDLPEVRRHRTAYITHLGPSFLTEQLGFNVDPSYQGGPNPVHDARVRLALALALDKIRLLERALSLTRREAAQAVAWTPWVNTPKFVQQGADRSIRGQWDPLANGGKGAYVQQTGGESALADARKLLARTPWKHGFNLDFYTTPNNPIRQAEEEAVASDWARIKIKVVPHFLPVTVLNETYAQGGPLAHGFFQVVMFAIPSQEPEVTLAAFLESKYRTRGAGSDPSDPNFRNVDGIHDRVIDQALEAAGRTFNTSVRSRSFAAVQRELNRQAYWIAIYPHLDIWTDDRRVEHASNDARYDSTVWNTYAWRLKR